MMIYLEINNDSTHAMITEKKDNFYLRRFVIA